MTPTYSLRDESKHEQAADRSVEGPVQVGLTGAKGGFVATLVMTAYRLPISRSLPPTEEFWRRFVRRGDSQRAVLPAIVLHFLYGSAAGAGYVVVVSSPDNSTEARAELRGVATAIAYSVLLSVFGQKALLEALLREDMSRDEKLVFHLGHVVYGITLGTWLGSRRSS